MTGVNPSGFAPVFHFHEIQTSISKTEKCRLPDEIYKKTGEFRNYGSRKCKLVAECGLAKGNLQWPGILDLFSEPKV